MKASGIVVLRSGCFNRPAQGVQFSNELIIRQATFQQIVNNGPEGPFAAEEQAACGKIGYEKPGGNFFFIERNIFRRCIVFIGPISQVFHMRIQLFLIFRPVLFPGGSQLCFQRFFL